MEARELKLGEILQMNPVFTKNRMFAGCLCVVNAPKTFGAEVYVRGLGENGKEGSLAYYRAGWDELEETGGAVTWTE